MRHFGLALVLACVLAGTVSAGEIPTTGATAPQSPPGREREYPVDGGMTIDRAAVPFVLLAAVPAAVSLAAGPPALTWILALLPAAVALFFRDPERR